ncbi:MAG: AAA family ATPase [Defluviitaleaceae bacterium]|nr:AAA family ATPase [Defluviitaleaceae bacterium]
MRYTDQIDQIEYKNLIFGDIYCYNKNRMVVRMLCQFVFKNFKSYRDETIFDLQSESISEHADTLLSSEQDNATFLPVSVIYGPNGGGKSGILEALKALVVRVRNPIVDCSHKEKQKSLKLKAS